jgi:polyhydroxybutyrate depolymerase
VGALIGVAVLVVAAILVWSVQAIREQGLDVPPTSTPSTSSAPSTTEAPGRTTTTEPNGVTGPTSLPTSGRLTEDGALMSSCLPYAQPFPLQPLGCKVLSPPNIREGERLPLVIVLHGFNTSVSQEMSAGDWDAAVVRDRFVAEFPESNFSSWNAGGCCGLSQTTQVDDVSYVHKLVTDAKARPDIDPDRVYLVGNSNGGMMVYRYLCKHADELAGAASVEGTQVSGCMPNTPIPFLHVAARDDQVVPYLGGQSLTSWVLGVTFPGVSPSVDEFAAAAACPPTPDEQTVGSVTRRTWAGCAGGTTIELDSLAGWTHRWPNDDDYPATTEILSFFGLGG